MRLAPPALARGFVLRSLATRSLATRGLVALVLAVLAAASPVVPAATAQPTAASAEMTGTLVRRGWPDRLPQGREAQRYDALPSMDTLALGYRIADRGDAPSVEIAFRWTMGARALLDGREVDAARLPGGLRLVAFVLTADVVQNGRRVGGFTVQIDSTRLGAGQTLRLAPAVAWSHLIDGLSATEARQAVNAGATLENLRLARAAFAVYGTTTSAAGRVAGDRRDRSRNDRRDRDRRDGPSRRTVIIVDPVVDLVWNLAWLFVDDPYGRPRGYGGVWSAVNDALDHADGDDDTELLVPALAGMAAVGVAAWQAGSVGVYGADGAPLGVAGGYTGPRFGTYVQVGVSPSVFGLADRPEVAEARLLGYIRPRGWAIAPLFGLGGQVFETVACQATRSQCAATDDLGGRVVGTLGLAIPMRRTVLMIGGDVETGRFQAGVIARLR